MKKSKKLILLIIVIIAFLFIVFGILYLVSNNKSNVGYNQYRISDQVVEFEGTVIMKSPQLTDGHCLDDICVKNVAIYDIGGEGRIEYTVTNNSDKTVSGILKLNFGDTYTYVAYNDLESGKSLSTKTMYRNGKFVDVKDFKIEKLTDEEMARIKK